MKLLTNNDAQGEHASSWYAATCDTPYYPTLTEDTNCDVCIIGAGFTGLSTAIHLRKQGHSVTVLDAHRVGWGASGRNGGQLGSGLNINQFALEKTHGIEKAQAIWRLCENAKATIHSLCEEHSIDVQYQPGIIAAYHRARFVDEAHRYCEKLARDYDYPQYEPLSRADIRTRVDSPDYHGGVIDHGAGHIHPLALATGLAKAAEAIGVRIFELSQVVSFNEQQVSTEQATVKAPVVVLACNGYLDGLHKQAQQHTMPINNFIVATEPLGERAHKLLPNNNAVFDSRFVVNYFRLSADNRLLFGGGETYSYTFPKDIKRIVTKPMLKVFPQLKDVRLDYAWGGTLAITRNRAPYVRQLKRNLYCAGGYSGHGVALSIEVGKLIAEAINGNDERFNTLARIECPRFPGGNHTRSLALKAAMSWYALLDKV